MQLLAEVVLLHASYIFLKERHLKIAFFKAKSVVRTVIPDIQHLNKLPVFSETNENLHKQAGFQISVRKISHDIELLHCPSEQFTLSK